jgi:trans-aconitate methyltransferase
LDIGCGCNIGKNMDYIKNMYNSNIYGIEPRILAASEERKNGLTIFHGTLDGYDTTGQFDVIYMLRVTEHLPKPQNTLYQIFKILKSNKKSVIGTPQTNSFERYLFKKYWDGWDTLRHMHMFRSKTIQFLLDRSEFDNIDIYYEMHSIYSTIFNNKISKTRNGKPLKIITTINGAINRILKTVFFLLNFRVLC